MTQLKNLLGILDYTQVLSLKARHTAFRTKKLQGSCFKGQEQTFIYLQNQIICQKVEKSWRKTRILCTTFCIINRIIYYGTDPQRRFSIIVTTLTFPPPQGIDSCERGNSIPVSRCCRVKQLNRSSTKAAHHLEGI